MIKRAKESLDFYGGLALPRGSCFVNKKTNNSLAVRFENGISTKGPGTCAEASRALVDSKWGSATLAAARLSQNLAALGGCSSCLPYCFR